MAGVTRDRRIQEELRVSCLPTPQDFFSKNLSLYRSTYKTDKFKYQIGIYNARRENINDTKQTYHSQDHLPGKSTSVLSAN